MNSRRSTEDILIRFFESRELPPDAIKQVRAYTKVDELRAYLADECALIINHPEAAEKIHKNAQLYRAKFGAPVRQLKESMRKSRDDLRRQPGFYPNGYRSLPGFLDEEEYSVTFALAVDGKKYAVKCFQNLKNLTIDTMALQRASTIKNISGCICYSAADLVLIRKKAESTPMHKLDPSTIFAGAHVADLIQTIMEMHSAGLGIDSNPAKLLYDPAKGFTIIDPIMLLDEADKFHDGQVEFDKDEDGAPLSLIRPVFTHDPIENQMIELSEALTRPKIAESYYSRAPLDVRHTVESRLAELDSLETILRVLKERHPDLFRRMESACQKKFKTYRQLYTNHYGGYLYDPEQKVADGNDVGVSEPIIMDDPRIQEKVAVLRCLFGDGGM